MAERYLTRVEASAYLKDRWGVSYTRGTLAKLAVLGSGPVYRRMGNYQTLYTAADLDTWVENKLSEPRASTSEAA